MFEELREIIIEEPRNFNSLMAESPKTNLQTLYNKGWWITEIFGSYAVLVAVSQCTTRKIKKPYFICVQSMLDTRQITPKALKTINRINQQQWKKYKNYLLGKNYERQIQKPTCILLEPQRTNIKKTGKESQKPRIPQAQNTDFA